MREGSTAPLPNSSLFLGLHEVNTTHPNPYVVDRYTNQNPCGHYKPKKKNAYSTGNCAHECCKRWRTNKE